MLYFKIPLEMSLKNQLMQDLTARSHEADDSCTSDCISLPTYQIAVMHVEYMTHAPVDTGSHIISRYRARSVFL